MKSIYMAIIGLVFSVTAAAESQTFVFTAIPDQDETHLQTRFGKIANYLAKELQVDVKYVPVKSYAAAVTAFRNNEVQLAWFGGLSGVRARLLVPNSEVIAQGYEDQSFQTYFIAHKDTALKPMDTLTDTIRQHSFTFGSKGSTSGRLMPEYFLKQQFGESPDKIFSRVGFSGDHSRTIALVQSGAYNIGAVNFKVWERDLADGKVDTKNVSVIWKTPTYPDYQWSIRGDVNGKWGPGFVEKVKKALLDMDDPELLKSFPRTSFIPATNDDFQPVEDVARSIGLID